MAAASPIRARTFVASSTSGNVIATLAIDGTAHDPKITLSSVPPLPQDEVLAQLLFGSGVGKLGALEVAQIAAGLATLTGAGGGIGDPLDKVPRLGLDRLAVRNGANGNPALEAGRLRRRGSIWVPGRDRPAAARQASRLTSPRA